MCVCVCVCVVDKRLQARDQQASICWLACIASKIIRRRNKAHIARGGKMSFRNKAALSGWDGRGSCRLLLERRGQLMGFKVG